MGGDTQGCIPKIRYSARKDPRIMESLVIQGFWMFGLPAIGGQILRWGVGQQWHRIVIWAVLSLMSFGVMSGADWSPGYALLAIIVSSVLGGFAAQILRGIGENINGNSIRAVGILALVIFVYWFLTHASRVQLQSVASFIGTGIVLLIAGSAMSAAMAKK